MSFQCYQKTVVYVTFGFRPTTLESESSHGVIFVVTVDTGGCCYGNLHGHQWQEIWNCDNYRFWIQAIHTHQMTPLPTIFEGLWYESCAIQTVTHSLSVGCRTDSGAWPLIGSCAWWRHQMKTFSALLAICAGNSPVTGEFPTQRPVTWSFDFYLIWAWMNGWLNNREAVELRRSRANYDDTVMDFMLKCWLWM